jgi:S-adenosylmethionine:tRNA ribosyltransferase-isomerase
VKTSDFNYNLPERLIAQNPPTVRGQSRLMVLDRETGRREHKMVSDLPDLLEKGTALVFNDSRVRKARLFANSEATGARAEFLLLKKLDDFCWKVLAKRAKRRKPGSRFVFDGGAGAVIVLPEVSAEGELILRFDMPLGDDYLDRWGHVPLPPYIRREDTLADSEQYQTVYAGRTGSAAAPTAGLHFTKELLADLENAGMEIGFITLHVGLGTFLPVRTENIEDHLMHEEEYCINEEEAFKIEKAKQERKVLAVGTTSVRTLESAWTEGQEGRILPRSNTEKLDNANQGRLKIGEGSTSIFIYPGYRFKAADMLFTNFHTPQSTLLMLVSAFAGDTANERGKKIPGKDLIMEAYQEAIKEEYRFFSYGDAMIIR